MVLTKQRIERWYSQLYAQVKGQLYVYDEGMHVSGNGGGALQFLLARVARTDKMESMRESRTKRKGKEFGVGTSKEIYICIIKRRLGTASQQPRQFGILLISRHSATQVVSYSYHPSLRRVSATDTTLGVGEATRDCVR